MYLQERIKMFGFAAKYKGHWGSTEDSTGTESYSCFGMTKLYASQNRKH